MENHARPVPPRAVHSFSSRAIHIFCALLAFVGVTVAIGEIFPLQIPNVTLKWRLFDDHRDKYDVIFLGTSRVFHGIDPEVFDRTTTALGFPCRSFNAGIDGMGTGEAMAATRRMLSLHPRRWRYLFFEISGGLFDDTPTGNANVTERSVYWRDLSSLGAACRAFVEGTSWRETTFSSRPFSLGRLADTWPPFSAGVRLWARNQTNLGRGFELMAKKPPLSTTRLTDDPAWDGFFPMSQPMDEKMLTIYRKDFAKAREQLPPASPDPLFRSELERFARSLAAKNIRVFFLVPPSVGGARGGGVNAPDDDLFAYEDYRRHAAFYREENRLDYEHLNARGAALFSQTLASDFVQKLRYSTR